MWGLVNVVDEESRQGVRHPLLLLRKCMSVGLVCRHNSFLFCAVRFFVLHVASEEVKINSRSKKRMGPPEKGFISRSFFRLLGLARPCSALVSAYFSRPPLSLHPVHPRFSPLFSLVPLNLSLPSPSSPLSTPTATLNIHTRSVSLGSAKRTWKGTFATCK